MALKNRSGVSSISNEEMKRKLEEAAGQHADPLVADTPVSKNNFGPAKKYKDKVGRKKIDDAKCISFTSYFTYNEAENIKECCTAEERTVSAWIRSIVLKELNRE